MAVNRTSPILLLVPLLLLLLSSCAAPPVRPLPESMLAYTVTGDDQLAGNAPVFEIERPEHAYNRIGTPTLEFSADGEHTITIDPDLAHIFAEERSWQGKMGSYTNLIYRIHFREVPSGLIPFHLSSGKNGGLFAIVTLNDRNEPVLITTLHTCGCYLAFVPTSFLPPDAFPNDWDREQQYVFGEYLPGILNYDDRRPTQKLHILLRSAVHRVMDLRLEDADTVHRYQVATATLQPLESLSHLRTPAGETFSFFETQGSRKDYVVGNRKIRERLLISWWAFDWRVGEDKRLGRDTGDGPVFYTSLKPWARKASDLRDFAAFLDYWGWGL